MSRMRYGRSVLIVTKPSGETVQKEVELYVDLQYGTVGVRFSDEGQLRGYSFDILSREIERIHRLGEFVDGLPALR